LGGVKKWRAMPALRWLPPVLGVVLLTCIIFGLHRALERVSLGEVMAALRATPRVQVVHAVGLLAIGCVFMAFYDLPGVLFAKRSVHFPWIGFGHVWFASFCAYSLSHVLGAPTLSGTAIRVRLYAEWQVPAAGIGRIITLIGTTFPLGTASLIGGILLFDPLDMPLFGQRFSVLALRGIGAVLWAVIAAYLAAARGTAPLLLFGREIQRPGLPLALGQILLSCADTSTACAVLFVVLPPAPGLGFLHVLAIYLAGFAGGMFSGLPGGVGVLDTVLLLGLSGYMPAADAIGAILLYRVLYYLVPAAIGALIFASHEVWLRAKGERK
jgi:uncharacterized membrane protein YbhN (UPF0104 family)